MSIDPEHIADNIVLKAISHVGEAEVGNSNEGPQIDRYIKYVGLTPPEPWCAAFASFVVGMTLEQMGLDTYEHPVTGSSSQMYLWGKDHGTVTDDPYPGDVAVEKGGPTGHQHTLIVIGRNGSQIHCCSGNDGNRVACDWRDIGTMDYLTPWVEA